jgi:hypothetical protein
VTGLAGCGGDGSGTATDAPTTSDTTAAATPTTSAAVVPACDSFESLAQSDVNGGVTLDAGCYRVDSVHTIDSGTLTLEPGVVIEFGEDAGLHVEAGGALQSMGTAESPVFLRGATERRAHWRGVGFTGDGTNANSLEHTVVEHAGGELWTGDQATLAAVFVTGATVAIRRTTLRTNGGNAVLARNGEADLTVARTVFESNEVPIRVHGNLVGSIATSTVVENNDADRITVSGGEDTARDEISVDQAWPDVDVPFHVPQDLHLTASLTIPAGATFEFGEQQGLDVDGGHLVVEGTASDPVRFRGATSERGFWQGIRFRNTTAANALQHAVVRDAGGELWHGADYSKAGVFVQGDDARARIESCTVANNDVCGVTATGDGYEFTVENCLFEGNVEPLRVSADLLGDVAANNTFTGNDGSYVRVGIDGARTSVLREVTWLALDVPYRLDRDLSVRTDLAIAPGTTVEADRDEGRSDTVTVDVPADHGGSLLADASGADEEPIVFTGANGEPGYWGGVHFSTGRSSNALRNVVVEYGGGELNNGDLESKACVVVWSSGSDRPSAELEGVTLRGSGTHGLYKGCGAAISCADLAFEAIDGADIWDAGEDGPVSGCGPTC